MNQARKTVRRSDDVVLLTKFVSEGDEDAFAQIVGKYESLVWNLCCRILHNRCDAEDAFQTTFLLLATKAHRIRKPKSLSSWLYGVAFRTASSIRKQRQRGMLPYENSVDTRMTEDVLESVARKNENELVSAEIMLMKEKHKTPLLMFYFMGNSTTQIAETLGTTISAVEGRLRRAKQVLKLQLRLRGVLFDEKFAALIVPVLAISPSLKCATISKALAASIMKSTACLLSQISFGSNQIGARLMLTKIAISFGLVFVTSLGFLHHGGVVSDGDKIVQINNGADGQHSSTVPIKFVQDDEDKNEPTIHEHFVELHNHVYGVYQNLTQRLFQREKPIELHWDHAEIELKVTSDDSGENKFLAVIIEDQPLENNHEVRPGQQITWTVDRGEQQPNEFKFQVVGEKKVDNDADVPFLKIIPYVGRLFENVSGENNLEVVEEGSKSPDK